jgi:REP element-mobilizing transposase RayT
MQVFEKAGDYEAFERVLSETLQGAPMRIGCYCVMPNHWHMLLWPEHDGHVARFMQRLTVTHVRRWQENRRTVHPVVRRSREVEMTFENHDARRCPSYLANIGTVPFCLPSTLHRRQAHWMHNAMRAPTAPAPTITTRVSNRRCSGENSPGM